MNLTTQQNTTLVNHIRTSTDPAIVAARGGGTVGRDDTTLAIILNQINSPDFWVWRSAVTREEIYNETSSSGTDWSWTIYKAQAVPEQNSWTQMFMGDAANFSKPNVRAGISAIFGAANANTTHCLAIGRRKATRVERLFATGTGSTASPGTAVVEGELTIFDLGQAFNENP